MAKASRAATTAKPRRAGSAAKQVTEQPPQATPATVSLSELRRLKACRACSSTRLAPTTSLVGHVAALGVYALVYPRGKACKECGWTMEASY